MLVNHPSVERRYMLLLGGLLAVLFLYTQTLGGLSIGKLVQRTWPIRKTQLRPTTRKDFSAISLADLEVEYGSASSLFNAIHSSMRQFGSSLNHNGMTLFPARVPAGTLFYHGRADINWPNSPEWLAFEMEHANVFARAPRKEDNPDRAKHHPKQDDGDVPEKRDDLKREDEAAGVLHTFRTTRPLTLAYLDGLSAAKSSLGSMHLTDILIDWPISESGKDWTRAQALCDWQKSNGYELDGFLRMEIASEIILCDFASGSLELVSMATKKDNGDGFRDPLGGWLWLKAAINRYDDIGSSRVSLDYSRAVSIYSTTASSKLNYTTGLPTLEILTKPEIAAYLATVDIALKQDGNDDGRDWQGIADLLINRFATKLQLLHKYSVETPDVDRFASILNHILVPFLDYQLPESERRKKAIDVCTYESLPTFVTTEQENELFTSFEDVTSTICITLMHLHDNAQLNLERSGEIVSGLMDYLRWTVWKRCTGCKADEVCYVAMWPRGGPMDRTPNCVTMEDLNRPEHQGYWGQPGGGPR